MLQGLVGDILTFYSKSMIDALIMFSVASLTNNWLYSRIKSAINNSYPFPKFAGLSA